MFAWFRTDIIVEYWPLFLQGLWTTLMVTLIGTVVGTALGLLFGLGKIAMAERGPWKWPLRLFGEDAFATLHCLLSWHSSVCANSFDSLCCRSLIDSS